MKHAPISRLHQRVSRNDAASFFIVLPLRRLSLENGKTNHTLISLRCNMSSQLIFANKVPIFIYICSKDTKLLGNVCPMMCFKNSYDFDYNYLINISLL